MTQQYNLPNIRALLTQGFTDEELRRLCYDVPDFKPVYISLSRQMGKGEVIDRLLEHAETKLLLDALLNLAKQLNPRRYNEHQPYDTPFIAEGLYHEAVKSLPQFRGDNTSPMISKDRVQIYLQGEFSSLSSDRRSSIIDVLASLLKVPSEAIEVYRIQEGSIIFDLGIPSHAIQRLHFLLTTNNPQLRLLRVEKVIFEKEAGNIEEWINREGRFNLVTPRQRRSPMLKIFLSYARDDGNSAAIRLRAELERANFTVWRDIEDMQGGLEWKEQLRATLREVDVVLVLLTPAATASPYVTWEWENALTLQKRVIPLLISPCEVPSDLKRLHYHNLSQPENYSLTMMALVRDLSNVSTNKMDLPEVSTNKEPKDNKSNPHTITHIGNITGVVHTGSGDINVGNFSIRNSIPNKEELLLVLREFKIELESARQKALSEDTIDDTFIEVEAVEKEVNKEIPKTERIIKRLENAKAILTAGAGATTATVTAVTAVNKLMPLIEKAIQIIWKSL